MITALPEKRDQNIMDINLKDKVMIITGGAKGIGATIATLAGHEGALPIVLDTDRTAGNHLIKDIGCGSFFDVDLTDEITCKSVIETVFTTYGRIDILVNNAGINDGIGLDASNQDFLLSLQKNLIHYFTLAKLCWDHLKKTSGSIVNISSKVAIVGQGGTSGYAAAKGAILALTREWAVEGVPHGIRVNAVLPAEVYTPMYEYWLNKNFSDPGATRKTIENKIPLHKRMTTSEEIARTALYLASDMSSHTTGSFLYPDGGYVHIRS